MKYVTSKIWHLDRNECFGKVKPFSWSAELAILPGLPESNHFSHPNTVQIWDVGEVFSTSLAVQGFAFEKMATSLRLQDYYDEAKVEQTYYAEVAGHICKAHPEYKSIAILGHQVRKRSPKYPHEPGALVASAQPQTLAHSDLTRRGAEARLEPYYAEDEDLQNRPWEMINVWRVIKGPSNDWPLGLCDFRTVDVERDTIANDIVVAHGTGSIENSLLLHSPRHEWFYKSSMDVNDIIVFRQVDSTGLLPSENKNVLKIRQSADSKTTQGPGMLPSNTLQQIRVKLSRERA